MRNPLSDNGVVGIGFIGAGKRIEQVYLPIVNALCSEFRAVGFHIPDAKRGERRAKELSLPYFSGAEELVRAGATLLVVCVPPKKAYLATRRAARTGAALLLETPLAWDLPDARLLVRNLRGKVAGVAEQKPYLPEELCKQRIIASGLLGDPLVAENICRSFDYHAIAQLRSYLGRDLSPRTAQGKAQLNVLDSGVQELWEVGITSFNKQRMLVHLFSNKYKRLDYRGAPQLRIELSKGSIAGDEVRAVMKGKMHTGKISREERRGNLKSVSCVVGGERVGWENPFGEHKFSDDQIGVALHLAGLKEAMGGRVPPIYTPHDALVDLEVFWGMRLSADNGGCLVHFPLPYKRLRIRRMLLPSYLFRVARKISRILRRKSH